MDLPIVFGLIAAISWGSSDFLAKMGVGRVGYVRTALLSTYMSAFFLGGFSIHNVVRVWQFPVQTYLAFVLGIAHAVAMISLYKGFEVGQVSLVSPVVSGYPAISSILAVILLHENLSPGQLVGVSTIFVGMMLVSFTNEIGTVVKKKHIAAGVLFGAVALFCLGFEYFAVKLVVQDLGVYVPGFIIRLVAALVLSGLYSRSFSGRKISLKQLCLVSLVGVVAGVGEIAYNFGVSFGSVTTVSFSSGLFSAVTVVLAYLILKERVRRYQEIGIVIIMIGIVVMALFV